jgi:transposase-like protein
MNNQTEYRTMTRKDSNRTLREIKAMMGEDGEFLRPMVRAVIQEFLEAEMAEAVGAEKGERVEGRLSYRSGYYTRSLVTRVGKLELRVPQDRHGRFSTEIFLALPAQREGLGGRAHPDGHPGSVDAEGASDQ